MSSFTAKFIEKQIERERVRKGEQVRIFLAIFPIVVIIIIIIIIIIIRNRIRTVHVTREGKGRGKH